MKSDLRCPLLIYDENVANDYNTLVCKWQFIESGGVFQFSSFTHFKKIFLPQTFLDIKSYESHTA
jgi:hypothetical protein